MYNDNVCLMTTSNSVLFCRHVFFCFALLLGYKKEWKLDDFGPLFARPDNRVFEYSSSTQPGHLFTVHTMTSYSRSTVTTVSAKCFSKLRQLLDARRSLDCDSTAT